MQRAVGQSLLGKVALNGNALWIFAVLLSSRVPSECGHDLDLLGRDSDPSFGGIVTRISVACDIGTEAARRLPVGRLWNNFYFPPHAGNVSGGVHFLHMMDARVADGAAVLQNEAAIISSEMMCVEDDQFPWRSMMSPV